MHQDVDMRKAFIICLIVSALTGCVGSDTEAEAFSAAKKKTTKKEMTLEERGAKIYKRCRACHTLDEGGRHKVGPNLWDIYGQQAGTKDGYAYSKAMIASGVIWDVETMDAYLKRPKDYIPKTKMSFIGLKHQIDRDAVQAYILEATTPIEVNATEADLEDAE